MSTLKVYPGFKMDTQTAWIKFKCRFCDREHSFYDTYIYCCESFANKYLEIKKRTGKNIACWIDEI